MGNETALNKYLDNQEKQEKAFQHLLDSLEDELEELQNLINMVIKEAKKRGYDFQDEIRDIIKEMI